MTYPDLVKKTELPTRNAPLAALVMTFESAKLPYFPRKYAAEDLKIAGHHLRTVANDDKDKLTADELVGWGWFWRSYRRYRSSTPRPKSSSRGSMTSMWARSFGLPIPTATAGWTPTRIAGSLTALASWDGR